MQQPQSKTNAFQALTSSKTNEYYTPLWLMEAQRLATGPIDLDPASCRIAQRQVKAKTYYTLDDNVDPLSIPWISPNVWLNPPYGRLAKLWIDKGIREYESGNAKQISLLVRGDSKGIKQLLTLSVWIEFNHRIRFLDILGKTTDHPIPGVRLFYLGPNTLRFSSVYSQYGIVCQAVKL